MKTSSNLIRPVVGLMAVALVCGCAGRRAVGDRTADGEPRRVDVALPGQNRMLPSADPRNAPVDPDGRIGTIEREAAESGQPPSPAPSADQEAEGELRYQIQVLATRDREKAENLRDRLFDRLGVPISIEPQLGIWKVRVGREPDRETAEALRHRLVGLGYEGAFVIVGESR